jgi:hypothetical protein
LAPRVKRLFVRRQISAGALCMGANRLADFVCQDAIVFR